MDKMYAEASDYESVTKQVLMPGIQMLKHAMDEIEDENCREELPITYIYLIVGSKRACSCQ